LSKTINASSDQNSRKRIRKPRRAVTLQALQGKKRPTAWLRCLISPLDFGVKITKVGPAGEPTSKPIHCNTNAEILDAFQLGDWHRIERLSNPMLEDHWAGLKTYYYTCNGSVRNRYVLVNIDIDCHASGSERGAFEAAEYLKENFFPGLYHEPSTNGRGRHGYFILDKWDIGAEYVKWLLRGLERRLNDHLLARGFDIELCEIKGLPPVLSWGEDDRISNYTAGLLAKIPRQVDRFEEWKKTTVLSEYKLGRLCKKLGTPTPTQDSSDMVVTTEGVGIPAESKPRRPKVAGSIGGKMIGEDELAQIAEDGHYRRVATTLMESHVLETSGRSVVITEDVAIFMLCLIFFTSWMNADGTLPVRRFEGLWSGLYEAGDVGRSFDCHRFKSIRDYLSDLGLIDWADKTYVVPKFDESGTRRVGRACKWKAGRQLMEMLDRNKWVECGEDELDGAGSDSDEIVDGMGGGEERAPLVGTTLPYPHAQERPVDGAEREHPEFMTLPFIRPCPCPDLLREVIRCLTPVPDDRRIRPVEAAEVKPWRLSPEEVTRLIPAFEDSLQLLAA
jgi:hypothetical protein